MSIKRNYNYCCLFSKDNKCRNHGKTIVLPGSEKPKCPKCGSTLKLLGVALNVVFIGTQSRAEPLEDSIRDTFMVPIGGFQTMAWAQGMGWMGQSIGQWIYHFPARVYV